MCNENDHGSQLINLHPYTFQCKAPGCRCLESISLYFFLPVFLTNRATEQTPCSQTSAFPADI